MVGYVLTGLIAIAISIAGIAVAIFFGLRGFRLGIVPKLSKIEEQTKPIKGIEKILIKLDERTDYLLKSVPLKGTVEGALKNLGKVEVTAEPGENSTKYRIVIEKPVLKSHFIEKKSHETGLAKKERELFGLEPSYTVVDPTVVIMQLPSKDPEICSEYVTYFLKWLNSEYWESLKEIRDYEKIPF